MVLGSFYYGYVALQIPGGWLAVKVGGTRLFGLAVLIASVLTIVTPVSARASVILLIAVRVAEGLVLVSAKLKCVILYSVSVTSPFISISLRIKVHINVASILQIFHESSIRLYDNQEKRKIHTTSIKRRMAENNLNERSMRI